MVKTRESNKTSRSINDPIARKLALLVEINQAISSTLDLQEAMSSTLQILHNSYHIKSGAIFIINEQENTFNMVASIGYKTSTAKISYKLGEGLTGKIAETGKPVVVPQVSKEPLYLNRLSVWDPNRDREQTFIGVPIISEYKTVGVLVVNLPFSLKRDYDSVKKFIVLVASALLPQIRLRRELDLERQRLRSENVMLKQKLQEGHSLRNIIGNSHAMREVYEMVMQVAGSNTTVLIRGESGTGKELIAKSIHYNSPRKENQIVTVNCAAIPENLIESDFFGYEKGAFTGAVARKKGRFEVANSGTIFLDEIGDLSQMTQVKLLRVLQEQEFERVGGTETIKVDVRVIAATNADLERLIKEGKFREDLYYRLNVFSILLPPLRDRKTDILLLADHFMLKYGRQLGKSIRRISTPAIDMLMRYHWPGNVRELENCIERAVLVCQDQVIHSYHLPPTLQTAESSDTVSHQTLDDAISTYEKELINDALKTTKGNQTKAALLLGTTERIIGYKIKKHNIHVARFKT